VKKFGIVFTFFVASVALNSGALATDVLTSRGNIARTGLNSNETTLTPAKVTSAFGLLYNNQVDGQAYAQPLYVSGQRITVNGQSKVANVLYVATEHDSLYAFDADIGTQYWKTSLLQSGESPVSSTDANCSDLVPEIGITATPVIDRTAGPNGTIFVVAMSKNGTNFFHRLHAIDLSTGQARLAPISIQAKVTGKGPATTFVPIKQRGRSGLLLLNGIIYTAWGSFCDNESYSGWIIAYNEGDLSQAAVLNTDPNGSPPSNDLPDGSGNGIWQAGNGPAVDANGNIYVSTGNGPFDTNLTSGFPTNSDYGDSVLKLSPKNGLSVTDYFTPYNQSADAAKDNDLASGGPIVLPDIIDKNGTAHHLLVAAGKDSNLYLLNRDNLGKFNPSNNNQIYQELPGILPGGVWSSPAYFNGSIYYGGGDDRGTPHPLWQFQFDFAANPNKPLLKTAAVSSTSTLFSFPGATPTISSNGSSNGIVWAYENHSGQAVLHAYDATNLGRELFNSGNIGGAVKFAVPTVCNGRVFVGTTNSVGVFGLLKPGVAKDVNEDGYADLVWENVVTGQRAVWLLGPGPARSFSLGTVDPSWHIVGVGDFLGNGQADLVWENSVTGEHGIWLLQNGALRQIIQLPTEPTSWHIVGAADFDGDGQADLVWENSVTGERGIWLLKGGVLSRIISLPTEPTSWHIAGAADFDGDGQADLVWENSVTGERGIWLLKGGALSRIISLPTEPTSWHIAGAADFDGDGQADLVWENSVTGERGIWLLKDGGGGVSSIRSLPTEPTSWHIVDH
jgi:hypothetical protein